MKFLLVAACSGECLQGYAPAPPEALVIGRCAGLKREGRIELRVSLKAYNKARERLVRA